MTSQTPAGKVRFINPPNKLKMKVGSGGIDESLLDKGQQFIEKSEIDFIPYADDFLKEFSKYVQQAKAGDADIVETKEKIIGIIMQLKANGGMFRYQLVSDIADIALQFLEAIEGMDKDALAVLIAHENTLRVIITNKLKGDGGKEGYTLVKELDKACKRYFSKHKIET